MTASALTHSVPHVPSRGLRAYLLGQFGFDALIGLQRRLVYEVAGEPNTGAVIVCDHPSGITVGREGSRIHVRPGVEELRTRGWSVRWVSRGGGVLLHLPGQVACYPVISLAQAGLTPAQYVAELEAVVVELLREFDLRAEPDPSTPGVRIGNRRVAHIGVAIRGGVSCFGLILNVDPDLEPFRDIYCDGDPMPMTSIQRETPGRARVAAVRQQLVSLIAGRFAFDRISLFHSPPGPSLRPPFPPGSSGGGWKHAASTRTR